MLIKYKDRTPASQALFVADNASVVGDVRLAKDSSVWYGAVLRGDMNRIVLGQGSNVQDNVVIHVTKEKPALIGNGVSVGHGAVVNGCTIHNDCIIGMGAVLLTGCVIGSGTIVAAGCVVKEGMQVPPNSLVAGVPGVVKKQIDSLELIRKNADEYVELAEFSENS